MKNVFFLCGPHCSGKTSILKRLLADGVILERGSEIGKDLYYQRKLDTVKQNEDFELEITELEIHRDFQFFNSAKIVGIETWHPGNLAYALVRNPNIVGKLIEQMKNSPLINIAYGFHLHVSYETIYKRTQTFKNNKKWAADFYTKIDQQLDYCFKQLGLEERIMNIDANGDIHNVYEEVKKDVLNSGNV